MEYNGSFNEGRVLVKGLALEVQVYTLVFLGSDEQLEQV